MIMVYSWVWSQNNQTNNEKEAHREDDNDATGKKEEHKKTSYLPFAQSSLKWGMLGSDAKNHNKKNIEKHQIAELFSKRGSPSTKSLLSGMRRRSVPSGKGGQAYWRWEILSL